MSIFGKSEWEPYVGPQDGTGWRNPETDEIMYQPEPPGNVSLDGQIFSPDEINTNPSFGDIDSDTEIIFSDGGRVYSVGVDSVRGNQITFDMGSRSVERDFSEVEDDIFAIGKPNEDDGGNVVDEGDEPKLDVSDGDSINPEQLESGMVVDIFGEEAKVLDVERDREEIVIDYEFPSTGEVFEGYSTSMLDLQANSRTVSEDDFELSDELDDEGFNTYLDDGAPNAFYDPEGSERTSYDREAVENLWNGASNEQLNSIAGQTQEASWGDRRNALSNSLTEEETREIISDYGLDVEMFELDDGSHFIDYNAMQRQLHESNQFDTVVEEYGVNVDVSKTADARMAELMLWRRGEMELEDVFELDDVTGGRGKGRFVNVLEDVFEEAGPELGSWIFSTLETVRVTDETRGAANYTPGTITLSETADESTVSHEVGHHMHNMIGLSDFNYQQGDYNWADVDKEDAVFGKDDFDVPPDLKHNYEDVKSAWDSYVSGETEELWSYAREGGHEYLAISFDWYMGKRDSLNRRDPNMKQFWDRIMEGDI